MVRVQWVSVDGILVFIFNPFHQAFLGNGHVNLAFVSDIPPFAHCLEGSLTYGGGTKIVSCLSTWDAVMNLFLAVWLR